MLGVLGPALWRTCSNLTEVQFTAIIDHGLHDPWAGKMLTCSLGEVLIQICYWWTSVLSESQELSILWWHGTALILNSESPGMSKTVLFDVQLWKRAVPTPKVPDIPPLTKPGAQPRAQKIPKTSIHKPANWLNVLSLRIYGISRIQHIEGLHREVRKVGTYFRRYHFSDFRYYTKV